MTGKPPFIGRRWIRAATAVVALLAAGTAPAAAAAGAARTAAAPLVRLDAVSCPSSSWCLAVGGYTSRSGARHAVAQVWDGRHWRVLRNPPGRSLTSVSCSWRRSCLAAGGPTGIERWNGRSWRELAAPAGASTAPSCGSQSLCMVINAGRDGSGGIAESWNGRTWRTWPHDTSECGGAPGPCGLAAVSCGSASDCVAVGTQTISQEPVQQTVAVAWNGTAWSRPSPPGDGNPAALNAVSCAGSFCMAVGGAFSEDAGGSVAVAGAWNAATQSWTDVSPSLGVICRGGDGECSWTSAISCGSATNCLAFFDRDLAWNGVTWGPAPTRSAGRGSDLLAASCGAQICLAVGYRTIAGVRRTLAELWNGTAWKILATPRVS